MSAAGCAVKEVLKVREGERVLIVTNPEENVARISRALYDAVLIAGGAPVLMFQDRKSQLDYAEETVLHAIACRPDILISMSSGKIGRDRNAELEPYRIEGTSYDHIMNYLLAAKKMRSFWSPGVTADMFAKTVPIDYSELRYRAARIKSLLDDAVALEITNPLGTALRVGLRGRRAYTDDGDYSEPGSGGNLPAGETFISPALGTSEGLIVFDGSITLYSGDCVIDTPIRAGVTGGFVRDIEGGREAALLMETITMAEENAVSMEKEGRLPPGKGEVYRTNARNIGEIGIGLNPAVEVSGNMLGDEKAFRTCHIAIGENYDEDAPALIHLDGLVCEPTMTACMDNGSCTTFMKDGRLEL